MTLSEILDAVLLQSGVSTESAYATSEDDEVLRLVALANLEAQRLARWHWQALRTVYSFTLSTATSYQLPDDFGFFVPDTMFLSTDLEGADFPTNADEWVYLQTNSTGTAGTKVRILGDNLLFYDPEDGATVKVEYVSKYPVKDSGGTAKHKFTADTDTFRLDDDLLIQCLIASYKRMMGQEWQADMALARELEQTLKGQDGGAKTVGPCEDGFVTPYYDLWRPYPNT